MFLKKKRRRLRPMFMGFSGTRRPGLNFFLAGPDFRGGEFQLQIAPCVKASHLHFAKRGSRPLRGDGRLQIAPANTANVQNARPDLTVVGNFGPDAGKRLASNLPKGLIYECERRSC
jgi:hypothetical protein